MNTNYICVALAVVIAATLVQSLDGDNSRMSTSMPTFEVDHRNYVHMKNSEQNKRFLKAAVEFYENVAY